METLARFWQITKDTKDLKDGNIVAATLTLAEEVRGLKEAVETATSPIVVKVKAAGQEEYHAQRIRELADKHRKCKEQCSKLSTFSNDS